MNKQEILNEINRTEEHLANMKKMLEECEYERWKPQDGEKYWFVDCGCNVCGANNAKDEFDIDNISTYNCFKTEEEAQREADKIFIRRQLEDIAKRLNKGKEIKWDSSYNDDKKYYIYFDTNSAELFQSYNTLCKQESVYCLSEDFKDVAIQEIGEERLKKYLRSE